MSTKSQDIHLDPVCIHMAKLMLGLAEKLLFQTWQAAAWDIDQSSSRKVQLEQHGLLLALLSRDLGTQQQLRASWQLFWEAD